jgi:hypothetical protein
MFAMRYSRSMEVFIKQEANGVQQQKRRNTMQNIQPHKFLEFVRTQKPDALAYFVGISLQEIPI